MDKNEVITLSSDEESDFTIRVDQTRIKPSKQSLLKSSKIVKSLDNFKNITINRNIVVNNINKNKPDEVIGVVVESTEKSVGDSHFPSKESAENIQYHSKSNVDGCFSSTKKISTEGQSDKISVDSSIDIGTSDVKTGTKNEISEVIIDTPVSGNKIEEEYQNETSKANQGSNQNLTFFTEFVDYCGSLEEIQSDRAKLTKKLMKRYGEADCHYIKSEEFRCLIQKFRDKVTKNNLYIIAKEITDELIYRKKIEINTGNKTEKTCQRSQEPVEKVQNVEEGNENKKKGNKRQTKVISRIIKNLDKLGLKIRELEEKEVDLSDEEESVYVELQRYRERFYQIYKKLCKFTNQLSDIDRIYNRRICFTESKYPEINKCIENWLNKTKRFPDFSDIMKLLESQSASLNLPSNKEAIRAIAIEIFQQVGRMLQRRRKYDLWDSYCGYLNDQEDPASKDTALDEILKRNSEIRIKKEQEIFKHYAELQDKQRLEPEEVPDEEANRSPVESGNEDEEEIEKIEELANRRLDDAVKDAERNGESSIGINESDEEKPTLEVKRQNEASESTSKTENTESKESKNNYKNCKSLKWRTEGKVKSESLTSEDSNTEHEEEKEKEAENSERESTTKDVEESSSKKAGEDDSDLELIAVKEVKSDARGEIFNNIKAEAKNIFASPLKRTPKFEHEVRIPEKRMRFSCEEDVDFEILEIDDENENPGKKMNEVIDIHCCQIVAENFFDDFDEKKKNWGKRKVFRDLTNLNRLMELHGKRRKASGVFSSSFFHRNFCEFEKSSWKKKFKVNFRSVGARDQKCALNQEENSGKTVSSDSAGDSDEKDVQNNSERRGDEEGNNFFSGHGNGNEGDNNEDENKKNGRTDVELNETQREEDEEEEEEENNTESMEHSLPNQKTEEQLENKTPSELADKSNEEEVIQETDTPSETQNEERKEDEEESSTEVENKECVPEVADENQSIEPESEEKAEDNSVKNEEAVEAEESKEEKEEPVIGNENGEVTHVEKLNEVTHVEKLNEVTDEEKPNEVTDTEKLNEVTDMEEPNEVSAGEKPNEVAAGETPNEVIDGEKPNEVAAGETPNEVIDGEKPNEVTDIEKPNEVTDGEKPNEVTAGDKPNEVIDGEKPNEVTAGEKPNEDVNDVIKSISSNEHSEGENENKINKNEITKANSRTKIVKTHRTRASVIQKEYERGKVEIPRHLQATNKPTSTWKSPPVDSTQTFRKRSAPSTSDEEIVKRFLLHSPSSISITPPRKLSLTKSPSQSALQALATLRNLKGISATIVRGKPKNDAIGSSYSRRSDHTNQNMSKRGRSDFPVISNVQTITPKIVNVSGNVSGFDNSWPGISSAPCDSSPIRISNVWGSLPNNFMQTTMTESPGCSSQKSNPGPSNAVKKKNTKKTVEYVVLD